MSPAFVLVFVLAFALAAASGGAAAQTAVNAPPTSSPGAPGWQQCAAFGDSTTRLACYDRWADAQSTGTAALASSQPAAAIAAASTPVNSQIPATRIINVAQEEGCKDRQYSDLSRFWELETGTDCGTFNFRGYRPISLSYIASDSVNTAPYSPSPGHTAGFTAYKRDETRLQLSVRTKIAQGLLTQGDPVRRDSVWIGYTQQSYWQLFNGAISRPFRSTDHEPEIVYAYPADAPLPGGWRLRYGGIGLVHQSNGQSLPLSRSWNRVYLMTGAELGDRFTVQARLWKRIPESSGSDDNPDISNYIGRGELSAWWNVNKDNTIGLTLRHSLASQGNGSARLEWLQALGNQGDSRRSGLRLHTQLFTGYGDSLLDYNRRRTVLSVGLSLVDF
jgi:phospholipase A1